MAGSDVRASVSFDEAAIEALTRLQASFGFSTWLISRQLDGAWLIVHSVGGHEAGLVPGLRAPWPDTLCARLVEGEGPTVAAWVDRVRPYRQVASRLSRTVKAYLGVPLRFPSGELFGTLCALDPEPQPDAAAGYAGAIELAAQLLATVLVMDLDADSATRRTEVQALAAAHHDGLTGLADTRAVTLFLEREAARQRKYGHDIADITIEIDEGVAPGGYSSLERCLRRAADATRANVRSEDLVARTGRCTIEVLAADLDERAAMRLLARLDTALSEAAVLARATLSARRFGPDSKPLVVAPAPLASLSDVELLAQRRARRADARAGGGGTHPAAS